MLYVTREKSRHLSELKHGEFTRVAEVKWPNMFSFHQPHQTLHLQHKIHIKVYQYTNKQQCKVMERQKKDDVFNSSKQGHGIIKT